MRSPELATSLVVPCRAILRYYCYDTRDTFSGRLALPHNGAIPPFTTILSIIVRYPTKTSKNELWDAIVASIARYAKYRYWASKPTSSSPLVHRPGLCLAKRAAEQNQIR